MIIEFLNFQIDVFDMLISGLGIILYIAAGISDWKKRVIPNYAPLLLFVLGLVKTILFYQPYTLFLSIAGFIIPSVIIIIGYHLGKNVGGGDLKIMAATGFLFGLINICFILLPTFIFGTVYSAVKRESVVPLGTFLAVGVVIYYISYIIWS